MSIYQNIQTDLITSLKNKEQEKLNILRFIVSQVKYKQIDAKVDEVGDDLVVGVIRKQVKELSEAAAEFDKLGRTELSSQNKGQIQILEQYLPKSLSESELTAQIEAFIAANKPTYEANKKAFTGRVVAQFRTVADPSLISRVYMKLSA